MKKNNSCLVLFSGGQDSTTCLFWAKEKFANVTALNLSYGQRHSIEIQSARDICSIAKIDLIELKTDLLSSIGDSALFDQSLDISRQHRSSSNLPASFVPGRNLLFLVVAGATAFKIGVNDIVTGVCETDYSGYPDCRHSTIKSLELSIMLGMDYPLHIHTPLMYLSKADTVKMAKSLPGCWEALAISHTCYEGKQPPCGKCPSCLLRQKGFDEAGEIDPLVVRFGG